MLVKHLDEIEYDAIKHQKLSHGKNQLWTLPSSILSAIFNYLSMETILRFFIAFCHLITVNINKQTAMNNNDYERV